MAKPDLNKLKSEIQIRKKERVEETYSAQGAALMPADQFLNGLLESLKTGRESKSTNIVKIVSNKTALREGQSPDYNVNDSAVVQNSGNYLHENMPQQSRNTIPVDMSEDREEEMFKNFENAKKKTLAESMGSFITTAKGGQKMVAENHAPSQGQPMLNEAYLIERVQKVVNNYLSENLAPIFEDAIKNTIIEMYAVERIKEVLTENREMIKSLVYETIREIQAKSKNKTQQ